MDAGERQADALWNLPGAARDPHRRVADLGESRSTTSGSSAPTSAAASATRVGGLCGLRLLGRRLHRYRQAGEMGRGPDGQPDDHGLPPATTDEGARSRPTKQGKITGLWCHVTADHGGFDACADPTKFLRRVLSTSAPAATTFRPNYLSVDGCLNTNKATVRPVSLSLLPIRGDRSRLFLIERMNRDPAPNRTGHGAAELRRINFIKKEQFSLSYRRSGWEYDSGDYHNRLGQGG